MSLMLRSSTARALLVLLAIAAGAGQIFAQSGSLSPESLAQIQALMDEKRTRTPAQQKVDSNLLYEAKQRRGLAIAPGVPTLHTGIVVGSRGEVVVDITATVTDSLLATLKTLGGRVLDSHPAYRSIRAEMPLAAVETLAAHPDVLFINRKQEAVLNRATQLQTASPGGVTPFLSLSVRPGFAARAATVRSRLGAILPKGAGKGASGAKPLAMTKINTSEGVVTHRADLAQAAGATGTGVKVGVLSDGVDSLASLVTSGDLPAGVTVLSGQAGSGDEGSAMLEIVYDMAPGAQLYFATAFNGITSFAQNIKDLRTAGCDIIIDDVSYLSETPFQKGQAPSVLSTTNGGIVIQAVNDVTAAGALYFSSAANSGGKDKNTSGTWEGDFSSAGATTNPPETKAGLLLDFDPGVGMTGFDTFTGGGGPLSLFWSDPLGGSGNDYDLYFLTPAGAFFAASTNTQSGTQDPFEFIGVTGGLTGYRAVVVKVTGAANRFLHLDTNRAKLTFNTQGSTHGHNAPPSANAFCVAATPAAGAAGPPPNPTGPYPSPFNSSNTVEIFSSDGPRQYFFNADSSAITPGNFSSTGGQILQKPDITAADGVACAAPGFFNPFFGTSAAAPHAGAIAALVKSANPSLTASQISAVLMSTAIDIEGAGWDRDSGVGILDAFAAVQAVTCTPPSATITAPASVPARSAGNMASVPDAGIGATYSWGITNGTITAGQGTRTITFTAGIVSPVGLDVTVTKPGGCDAMGNANVTVVLPNRVFVSARTGNDLNNCASILTPCQTLAGSLVDVAAGGEVIVLDSGGYGAFTVTHAVTIEAPPGVLAFVHPPSGDAATVNAGVSDTVVLRGLTLNGGASNGIALNTVGALYVENCVISGFVTGLSMTGPGQLFVKDTIVRGNSVAGVNMAVASGTAMASIDRSRFESNGVGLMTGNAAKASIRRSVASGNASGLVANGTGAELDIDACLAANNSTVGIAAGSSGGTVRITRSTVTDNAIGLRQSGSGTLLSRTDNTVEGNTTDTSGTIGSYSAK